jgi:hypothetical protein
MFVENFAYPRCSSNWRMNATLPHLQAEFVTQYPDIGTSKLNIMTRNMRKMRCTVKFRYQKNSIGNPIRMQVPKLGM